MPELGIVIVSHSADIAKGLVSLIREVAPDIPLTATGGLEDGGLGSSFDHVQVGCRKVSPPIAFWLLRPRQFPYEFGNA